MGLADTLGFGKTASFQATITVHELLQVPLLNAKFRIKWKFKGATHALVHAASDDALAGSHHPHRHGFAERFLHPRTALSSSSSHATLPTTPVPADRPDRDRTPSGSRARSRSPYAVYSSEDGDDVRSPTQSPPVSPDARPNRAGTSAFTFPSTSSNGGDTQTLYATPSNRTATYDSGTTTNLSPDGLDGGGTSSSKRRGASDLSALASSQSGSGPGGGAHPAAAHRPEPKGSTTFVPLRAHTAVFAREITCPVQVTLRHVPGSSKYQLQPCPVRLAVHQEVPGEDGKREEEHLGEVILDLSQFAAHPLKGGATAAEGVKDDVRPRRYLLQNCKSNAVLRVSVKMQWIDGEKLFVAPAFRTGQLSTGSAAAKGLDSGRNSPANRSSASITHKGNVASSTPSPTRLSGSNYARSTTSTASVNRSNSTSSIGSLPGTPSPLSAASSIAAARDRTPGPRHRDHQAQGAGARSRKPKKVWHPSSTLSAADTGFNFGGPPPQLSSTHIGGGSTSSLGGGGGDGAGGRRGRMPVRSATDIVEDLFNRPLRRTDTDGTVTLSVVSTAGGVSTRDMHGGAGGGLGEPIELRHGGGGGLSSGWKAHKARRSAAKSSAAAAAAAAADARSSGGEAAPSSSKAWSIRPRTRDKHRDRAPAAPDAGLPGFERNQTSATERVGRTPQEDVPQPTPATYAKTEAPVEVHRQRERARWLKDVTHDEQGRRAPHPHAHEQVDVRVQPPTPQLLSSSHGAGGPTVGRPNLGPTRTPSSTSVASSVASSSTKALSVRWGDRPPSTSSTPASAISSSANSSSSTELGPRHGGGSSVAAAGAGGERRLVPLRSQRSYDALGIARPASSASFSSLVTPPSPDRRDTSQRGTSASGTALGQELGRAPARRAGPGERAPGGAEWGRSWG
ncbi:uncharacterized protein RHOBADRAFT_53341 [Rhodotorula graminis WP1]|uniref:C2 NT-type domain-containing protein n=1 Tax=Rhodotorula graminis (strain WP1) TaxID=578459 RepID=A0A194S7G6_RHOGW|nr:uncharacterized protein RHOBADRAFT_53341 [Rhodotorula graminis WP1]KPV75356.1 hypothetical protein RHOBADRAFT_53341 [Rhodotorula graminis WP1]